MMKLSELAKRDFDRLKNDEKSLDFKIDSSSEIKSDVVFSRSELGDELSRLLDIEIGRRILADKFQKEELKYIYFSIYGYIYPGTNNNEEPTTENIKIYDMSTGEFVFPKLIGYSYYIGDEFIRCNSKLWPVIRSLAEKINV